MKRRHYLLVSATRELTKQYTVESGSKNESNLENNNSAHHRPSRILYYR